MGFTKNGAEIIQKRIDSAKEDGTRKVCISGNYEIEKTILIPSGFYLILENCHLRLGDNTFCNIFTNENCRTEIGRTGEGTDRNITIEGRGAAILDGGTYNGLSERNSGKDGRPDISVNNTLLFANVDGFKISGLSFHNQRWWAMNFLYCCNGKIRDIDFCSNPYVEDENGNLSVGFQNTETQATHLVKNGDGIDLRVGCHDIIIENITGFCEDDTVAFTGISADKGIQKRFTVEGASSDMYNLIVRNVNACSYCAIVRLLNQGGVKLYNVLIDGVYDSSRECPYLDRGLFAIRIGDKYLYGDRHATEDECFNITVRNVFARTKQILNLGGSMKDIYLENIKGFDGNETFIVNHSTVPTEELIKNV